MAKIMAVDDEPDVISLLRRVLERAGFEFVGCRSGKECLEKYREEKPDLVLLDVMMPGMDGSQVYRQMRGIDKKQKIAFLTALGLPPESKEVVLERGAADYITKPFEPKELIEKVKAILKK